jgi:poly(3-hydroxybutyrate) depolymerase
MRTSIRPLMRIAILPIIALVCAFSASAAWASGQVSDGFGGRDLIVYVPSHLPPVGQRALVVVLHGGLGNARRIASARSESGLNMDAVAEKNGFLVVYLNGTLVTKRLGAEFLGWNAGGGCCGQSAANNIDDVAYIQGAVGYLARKYGVDRARVFGMGHSNGAMMTQLLICETHLYAAGVAISGPLNLPVETCPAARGQRVLAIHGDVDENVPIGGGRGTKGMSGVAYASEAHSQAVMTRSGARYDLMVVKGADHKLEDIDTVVRRTDGQSIAQKAAAFFGLVSPAP